MGPSPELSINYISYVHVMLMYLCTYVMLIIYLLNIIIIDNFVEEVKIISRKSMGWDGMGEASKEDAKRKGGSANCKEKKIVNFVETPLRILVGTRGDGVYTIRSCGRRRDGMLGSSVRVAFT